MENITNDFIDYLFEKYEKITENELFKSKQCMVDYIGVVAIGMKNNASKNREIIGKLQSSGDVEIIGHHCRADIMCATLINAFNAHSLELDDGHRFGMMHLGASIITGALAIGQKHSVSGINVLKGIVMGYESAARLAIGMQPYHKNKGYHTSGTCGTVGVAVGMAFALEMSKEELKTVISAAVTSASGLLEIQGDNSQLKPYNIAKTVPNGLMAGYMAYGKWIGPSDIIGGERGFANVLGDGINRKKILEYNSEFEINRVYHKPYAACRHCHGAIEGALELRKKLSMDEIRTIEIETYKLALKGHDHTVVESISSAKLSIPYSTVIALIKGKCGFEEFTERNIQDSRVKRLLDKVIIKENKALTALCPSKRATSISIENVKGESFEKLVYYAKGEPENPMKEEEFHERFLEFLSCVNESIDSEKIYQIIMQYEELYEQLPEILNTITWEYEEKQNEKK